MASMKRKQTFYMTYDLKHVSKNLEYNIAPDCPCWICNLLYSKRQDDNARIIRSAAKRCDNFRHYHDEYNKFAGKENAKAFVDFLRGIGLKVDSYIKKKNDIKPPSITKRDIKREEREKALLEKRRKKQFEKNSKIIYRHAEKNMSRRQKLKVIEDLGFNPFRKFKPVAEGERKVKETSQE
jgi:hypothetical protein